MPPGAKPTMIVIGLLGRSSASAGHGTQDSRTATATAYRTIRHIGPSSPSSDAADRLTPPPPAETEAIATRSNPALVRREKAAASDCQKESGAATGAALTLA